MASFRCPSTLPSQPRAPRITSPEAAPRRILTWSSAEVFPRIAFEAGTEGDGAPEAGTPLAWLVFTSGTSGEPKGVEVPHDGVLPVLDDRIAAFRIDASSRCLWVLSPGFDASLSDVFTALLAGATLVVAPALRLADPRALVATLRGREITHVDLPPALLPHLDCAPLPATLRTIVIGGEVADPAAVRRFASRVHLVSVYGPTEATICTSVAICDEAWARPSIGAPIGGARYRIEDGELLIGGPGVARGYRGAPALTKTRFVVAAGERWFRTGDRVRRDADGTWLFEGRIDRQRKVRGNLVAPEEIERRLEAHPAVRRAAVTLEADVEAWVELAREARDAELRAWVAETLPSYMVPSRITRRGRLPETEHHKLDRRALLRAGAPPASPLLVALTGICARVLGRPALDAGARFSDLGGTSLDALEVVARAEAMGLPLDAGALLGARSLAALATRMEARTSEEAPTVAALGARAAALARALPAPSGAPRDGAPRAILITGATGFLGARIVARLLALCPARLICLARDGEEPADARVRRSLEALGAPADRIEVIAADLTREKLGLDPSRWAQLAAEVDHVVHGAARVSVTAPWEVLHPANVEGTASILALAAEGRPKRVTYASTLSVFVSTDDAEGEHFEDRMPRESTRVHGGYAETKVAAELLVHAAAEHLSSTQVLRFGLLTGESASGRGPRGAWLPRTIRGLAALGVVPAQRDPALAFDVTPVDYAAEVTARLIARAHEREMDGVFHVAAAEATRFALLRRAMEDEGIRLAEVSQAAFRVRVAEVLEATDDADVGAACLALGRSLGEETFSRHRGLDLFEATRARFDTRRTRARMGDSLRCPVPSRALLRRYVRAAIGGAA